MHFRSPLPLPFPERDLLRRHDPLYPREIPVQLHLSRRSAGGRTPARGGDLGQAGGAARAARHRPIRAPADAGLRRGARPSAQRLPVPGAAGRPGPAPPPVQQPARPTSPSWRGTPPATRPWSEVLAATRGLVDGLQREVAALPAERAAALAGLAPIVGRENVLFDPFTLVSHATDATDWRLHLPFAVVTPTTEAQVAPLLTALCAARPEGHPARRRHRPHRGRGPPARPAASSSTRRS